VEADAVEPTQAYQLFMKETRATNTSLPKGKEAMVLIGMHFVDKYHHH